MTKVHGDSKLFKCFTSERTTQLYRVAVGRSANNAKVGLFVSYNHQDKMIADALVEALAFLSQGLEVFVDHSGIEGGDDYETRIHDSISRSQWFMIICPGSSTIAPKDMNWCFYEAGQFRARLEAENNPPEIRARMCCLYDGQIPGPLSRYQGTRISTTDRDGRPINLSSDDTNEAENTELFSLFETIIRRSGTAPLVDLTDRSIRKALRAGVRRVVSAFNMVGGNNPFDEIVFQPRISFFIYPSSDILASGLTPDTDIDGGDGTQNLATIFGITGRFTKWKNIKANALSIYNMEPLWVDDLEAAILSIATDKVPKQPETLCLANDGNFYVPIVARYEPFRSGKKRCYVAFIPSQSRRFAITTRSSTLLTGLILSVRFRQRILPIITELKGIQPSNTAAARQMDILCKLVRELVAIENEAVEFGLQIVRDEHDDPPLVSAFRDGSKKEELRAEISKWATIRNTLFQKVAEARSPERSTSPADAAEYVLESFADMRSMNSQLLTDVCEELLYNERVEVGGSNLVAN